MLAASSVRRKQVGAARFCWSESTDEGRTAQAPMRAYYRRCIAPEVCPLFALVMTGLPSALSWALRTQCEVGHVGDSDRGTSGSS